MSTKRMSLTVLAASAVLLTLGFGSQMIGEGAYAQPPAQGLTPTGVTVPYPGRLADATGQPVPDGAYDFTFTLYATETGGAPLWSETQVAVPVQGGAFQTLLGGVQPIPPAALDGSDRWLEVAVRDPEKAAFVNLVPRQRLSTATAPDSTSSAQACPHDHVGEVWTASIPWSNGAFKVLNYSNGPSIWGWNGGNGNGIRGYATGTGLGVYGESVNSTGVVGRSTGGRGVEGYSIDGYGVFAKSTNSDSIHVDGAGQYALNIGSSGYAAIYVGSSGGSGMYVNSAGGDGVSIYSATYDGIWINSAGDDGVHVNPTIGGVCYRCGWKEDDGFVVLSTGEVRSSIGFGALGRDFAVMMDVVGTRASYEAGDVLVAGDTGKGLMERSTVAYSPAIVGVYSAAPGFVGGQPVLDEQTSGIPVTIMGVVSCKASAENGAVHPGDLLVTSSTPGHAMRADRASVSPGVVLGKALESLEDGTGVILVLVTLQ